jgi:hypothetical protein
MDFNLRIVFVFICVVFMFATGCAKQQVRKSGFLDNYDNFGPGRKGGVKLVYFNENVDFKKYNKVMLNHVVFFYNADSKYKGIHPGTLNELSSAFHKAIAESLEGAYPIVGKPGPDVMRIRVAITDVVPGKPGLATLTSVLPGGFAVKAIRKAETGSYAFVGQTSMEAEILDSLSNERIAAAMDSRGEGEEKVKLTRGMTKWGDIKDVFKFWAKRLRLWLDETH